VDVAQDLAPGVQRLALRERHQPLGEGRSSFALPSVVVMRSLSKSAADRF
jgi:hypothetical protein